MGYRKPYQRPMTASWWQQNRYYQKYMLRESSSIFVAIYSVNLMLGLFALTKGPTEWHLWLSTQTNFFMMLLHTIIFGFVIYHAVTWFSLAPKTIPVRPSPKITDKMLELGHYVAWAVATCAVFVLFFW